MRVLAEGAEGVRAQHREGVALGDLVQQLLDANRRVDVALTTEHVHQLAEGEHGPALARAVAESGVTSEHALQRMINAGAVPVTWIQVLLELQRDWARGETYGAVMEIVKEHGGAYGLGVVYAQSVIGAHAAG